MKRRGARRCADKDALLSCLTPEERAVIDEHRELLSLGSHWNEAPGIVGLWELVAWGRRIRYYELNSLLRMSRSQLEGRAAQDLGLSAATLKDRLGDQRKYTLEAQARAAQRVK